MLEKLLGEIFNNAEITIKNGKGTIKIDGRIIKAEKVRENVILKEKTKDQIEIITSDVETVYAYIERKYGVELTPLFLDESDIKIEKINNKYIISFSKYNKKYNLEFHRFKNTLEIDILTVESININEYFE